MNSHLLFNGLEALFDVWSSLLLATATFFIQIQMLSVLKLVPLAICLDFIYSIKNVRLSEILTIELRWL